MTKNKLLLSTIGALVAVSLTAFAICGCAQPTAATPPAEDFTAPNMGTPADLVATNGTVPTVEADALQLFGKVCGELYMQLNEGVDSEERSKVSSEKPVLKPVDKPKDLNREVTIGTGKATISGLLTPSSTRNTPATPTANTRYDSYRTRSIKGNATAILEGVTFTSSNGITYTVSGKTTNKIDEFFKRDILTGLDVADFSDAKYYTDIGYKRTFGVALSVKASNGAGAKFIISKSVSFAKKAFESKAEDFYLQPLATAMEAETATLKIYDDGGNLKYEKSVPYRELIDLIDMSDLIMRVEN